MRPCGASAFVAALDVDAEDEIPIGILHVLEADIAEDTGIVNEDIDAAESLDGRLNNSVTIFDAVVICDGLSASGLDFVDDDIGSL